MNETTTTLTGNLTADPELRFTQSGTAVANFTVASTPRSYDRTKGEWVDGEPLFLRCTLWRQPAEHLAESLRKGDRVIVTGRLRQRSYETRDGDKRTTIELDAYEVGASLQFRAVKPATAERTSAAPASAGTYDDEPPF